MDWQTIDTAPKDGTEILLYYDQEGFMGCVQGWWFSSPKEINDGWEFEWGFIGDPGPTHWMPLPEPPESKPNYYVSDGHEDENELASVPGGIK